LGIVNSGFIAWLFRQYFGSLALAGGYLRIGVPQISQLPIVPINRHENNDATVERIVTLVDQMLALHKSIAAAKTDHDKTALQRQIDATDKQIDQLVYQLYGLTDEEIGIVEEVVK
jgi:hypothetical protein